MHFYFFCEKLLHVLCVFYIGEIVLKISLAVVLNFVEFSIDCQFILKASRQFITQVSLKVIYIFFVAVKTRSFVRCLEL